MTDYNNAMPEQAPKGTYEELYVEALKREQYVKSLCAELADALIVWEWSEDKDGSVSKPDALSISSEALRKYNVWKENTHD